MALAKDRLRRQEALNRMAFQLTEVNGELEFLAGLRPHRKDRQALLEARRAELLRLRASFFLVIKQYDSDLAPETLGSTFKWLRPYGRKATATTIKRYFDGRNVRLRS